MFIQNAIQHKDFRIAGAKNLLKALVRVLNEAELQKPFNWRFGNFFPQLIDLVAFLCINYKAMHLGQLAAWRRAMGFESALASLAHRSKPYN